MARELTDEEVFGAQHERMGQAVTSLFPGATVTSGYRDPVKNRKVGGAPNSYHTRGQAVDFVKPPGTDVQQIRANLEAQGLPVTELLDEGDHIHWAAEGDVMPPAQPVELSDEEVFGAAPPAAPARPQPKRPPSPRGQARPLGVEVSGLLANLNRGLVIGDEIAGGADAVGDILTGKAKVDLSSPRALGKSFRGAFDNSMKDQRALEDDFMARRPIAGNLAVGTGLAPTVMLPGGAAVRGAGVATRVGNAGRAAVTGATQGAGYGLLDRGTVEDRVDAGQTGAAFGGLLGGAIGGAARTTPKTPKVKAPSVDELKAQKSAAYKAVDDAGVTFKDKPAMRLALDIADLVDGEGGADLYPQAAKVAKRIENVVKSGPLTLTKLDKLRQQVGEVVQKDEPIMAARLREVIDGFIDAADESKLASGGKDAAKAIRKARELNTRFKKVETVTNALESADLRAASTYSGGNVNNTIRQNLRPLIDPRSNKRMRNLTPEERKALNAAVRGTPAQNVVRASGKILDPFSITGGLMQAGLGVTTGGMSLPSAGLGMAATALGNKMSARNVEKLLNVMASGGKEAAAKARADLMEEIARNPAAKAYVDSLMLKMSRGAGAGAVAAANDDPRLSGVGASVGGGPVHWGDGRVTSR